MHKSEQTFITFHFFICPIKNDPELDFFLLLYFPGVYRDFRRGDALQAGGYGSILLLPGGLELFRWLHCDAEFSGAGSG